MPEELSSSYFISSKTAPLIEVKDITAGYGKRQEMTAVENVNLTIESGETVGIIGESGSGKTTLGRIISGLMAPRSGVVMLNGKPLHGHLANRSRDELRDIQFAFQMADVALNPRQKIEKILGRPMLFYKNFSKKEVRFEVEKLLSRVELPADFSNRYPSELSGGQRQRVNLARALAAEPKLIICDEITSALDTIVAQQILDLLQSLQEELGLSY